MTDFHRIALVGHLFFPFQTPRAMRLTELANELSRQGHDVTVFCLTGNYDYSDYSKETGVKVESIGHSRLGLTNCNHKPGASRVASKKTMVLKLRSKVLSFLRRNFCFPEIELTSLVSKALKNRFSDFDLIISIGRPYEIHWGIARISKHPDFPYWISDCGAPFMGNPFSEHPFYFKYVEKWWGNRTDAIAVPIESARNAYYPEVQHKIHVIPQGFNFSGLRKAPYIRNSVPTFIYAGALYPGKRDPGALLKFLSEKTCDFRFIVYTQAPELFSKAKLSLGNKLEVHGFIPRQELIYELSKCDFVVNIKNSGTVQSPSKLIDYFYVCRPVVDVSSEMTEKEAQHFDEFLSGIYDNQVTPLPIDNYLIENVAKAFLSLPCR